MADNGALSPSLRKNKSPILASLPTSVHFRGFELKQKYQQKVLVRNDSSKSIRVQYRLPGAPGQPPSAIQATFSKERLSFLSPGLTEELLVTFTPQEFQYYHAQVLVKCEEVAYPSTADIVQSGRISIPIHAYPSTDLIQFPSRIDFGVVPLNEIARKQIDLSASVPVEFEFELAVTKPHPSFTIFPLCGTISSRKTQIEMEFQPTQWTTCSAELELRVSQPGLQPMKCMIVGSSASFEKKGKKSPVKKGNASSASFKEEAKERKASKRSDGKSRPSKANEDKEQVDDMMSAEEEDLVLAGTLTPKQAEQARRMRRTGQQENMDNVEERQDETVDQTVQNDETTESAVHNDESQLDLSVKNQPEREEPADQDAVKSQSKQKWKDAVSKVILQSKMSEVLKKIQLWIDGATSKEEIIAKVDLDWQRYYESIGTQSSPEKECKRDPAAELIKHLEELDEKAINQKFVTGGFPLVEMRPHIERIPIKIPDFQPPKFMIQHQLELIEPDEALLNGHTRFPWPAYSTFVPLENDRALLCGAEDEYAFNFDSEDESPVPKRKHRHDKKMFNSTRPRIKKVVRA